MAQLLLHPNFSPSNYYGLHGSAKGWTIARIAQKESKLLVICKDRGSAENLFADINFFSSNTSVILYPGWESLPLEPVSASVDTSAERIRIFSKLAEASPSIIVASIQDLAQRVLPKEILQKLCFSLYTAQRWQREELLQRLSYLGYRRVSLVEEIGEFAVRGGIIDIFPSNTLKPIRVEFLDNEIEAIKTFDAATQRSNSSIEKIDLLAVQEWPNLKSPDFSSLLQTATVRIKERARELEVQPREVERILTALRSGMHIPGIELLQSLVVGPLTSLFDLLSTDTGVVINEKISIERELDQYWDLIDEREARLAEHHCLIPRKEEQYLTNIEFQKTISKFKSYNINSLEILDGDSSRDAINLKSSSNIELITKLKTKVGTGRALDPLRAFIATFREQAFKIAFVAGSQQRGERLAKLLLEIGIEAQICGKSAVEWLNSAHPYPVVIIQGQLSEGVQLPSENLVFISENEVFAERSHRKAGAPKASLKKLLSTLAQLKENDFTVHVDYGIGVYRGLKHIKIEGVFGDFLQIEYADSTLYLPVQNISKIQKFAAADGQAPNIDKLSSNSWSKTKQKVRESVMELAGDLIKLYAERSVVKGWRFDPLGAEDERFADSFPFDETADQLRAIEETISDMARDRPMDRLICGDAGFGKTEVALRAAWKCFQHGRQVALLVPTTILVEQHRQTFADRFLGYPIKVGAISRFYSKEENRATLAQLASGDLDVVIGTHRLLQKDVVIKDLGLVIIDEEHRFGVKQKERLKSLKKMVDVLTLTATPIPRTLHMSLLGIRDISLISTAPHDRRVIKTYVAQSGEAIIRDAILRELQRGGQIFFLHNRVQGIEIIVDRLRGLVPEARFDFAHGQMQENDLEKKMLKFVEKKTDVLISTTIIESGLDIPNANTIIIDRADMFGLAQLYQLRGRVGRSNRQAYCYLLIPELKNITRDAEERLNALQALDDLGQGFQLAIRDLEIRGAGNLLGKEQSGNVLMVGFELYTKILKEAVLNLKGEELELEEGLDPEVKLGIPAFIPDYYIPDISERLILYQRLSQIVISEEADELKIEIDDRFGTLPKEVENLVELMRFRALMRRCGVEKAELSDGRLLLSFSPRSKVDTKTAISMVQSNPHRFRLNKSGTFSMSLNNPKISTPADVAKEVEPILRMIILP